MANTRITQGVIKPNENYDTHNIVSTGIVTAVGLDINGNADISGSLSVGGVLTYEDVSSIDSVGIITAQKDIHVGAGVSAVGVGTFGGLVSPYADIDDFLDVGSNIKLGNAGIVTAAAVDVDDFLDVGSNIKLGNAGVITATSFVGSGAALTGIDATAIKDSGGNVKVQAQASGAMYTGIHTFSSGAEVGSNIKLGNAGVITATSFSGDGSNLTSLPAGLGTALSSTQSSPLNKIYYTNTVLPVNSTITVDPPASASAAYTQYADISIGSGADLIISDGDDLIPDVLGLRPDGTFGGGSLGRMRVDKIVGKDANSAVSFEKGIVITGVTTSTTFSGSGASLTNLPAANLTGTLPAISGANLTSLPAQATISNNADNRIITGGSGVNLNGEADFTYDGDNCIISRGGNSVAGLTVRNVNNSQASAVSQVTISGGDNSYAALQLETNGQEHKIYQLNTGHLGIEKAGVERLRINSSGNVEITDGNLVLASGHGIDFSATSDASGSTSELLDDYEEGSFSPTYDAPNQASAGFTHFHNYGYYTKVGNIVNVTIYIQGYCSSNASGGSNDDLKVVGLPFAPAVLPGSGSSNRHVANFAIGSRYKMECDDLTASAYGGNTYIDLLVPSNGGTGTPLKTNQADQNTTQFWATATYRVA